MPTFDRTDRRCDRLARASLGEHRHHDLRQFFQLVVIDSERGRKIDDRAERTDEYSLRDKARAQAAEIGNAVELDYADGALHAHVLDARQAAAWCEPAGQRRCNVGNLLKPWLALQQIERGIGGSAGERVAHIGWPM